MSVFPTVALFKISPTILLILTVATTFAVVIAGISNSYPSANLSTSILSVSFSSTKTFISPTTSAFSSTKTLFFKSESVIFVLPAISPLFFTEIVYVISSPFFAGASTSSPSLIITLDFVGSSNTGFFVGSSSPFSSVVFFPSAIATFFIVPLASSFTLTLNETE